MCASLWGSPGVPVFFTAHPYNKDPLLRRPDRGSIYCSPTVSQLAFFLAPLMNLSNLSIYLLIEELCNAYCVPGTTRSFRSERISPVPALRNLILGRERLGLHTALHQKVLPEFKV